jgi:hypothetical protein
LFDGIESFTLNDPLAYFMKETRMTSVGKRLAERRAIINEIEQTTVIR